MKKKLSISIEDVTINDIDLQLEEGLFRNRSHLIEYAVNRFLRGFQNE
ncbi:hypothetical protein JW930_05890 [Candidatus Woesearchaeota archaeon]|nr:hypothetical protein [Candidatus Woesearchaeota archaeon]